MHMQSLLHLTGQRLLTHAGHSANLSILFPEGGSLRIRKVVSRSGARPTYNYPSWKMGRMMQCESLNERKVYCQLDADASITRFYEQPAEITYTLEGKVHRHYPDTLVCIGRCQEFWEIKPRSEANKPDMLERTRLLTDALPHYGYHYRMVVAEAFICAIKLQTAQTLLKYGRAEIAPSAREQLRRLFVAITHFTWKDVLDGLLGTCSRQYACRLMLEGQLSWDVSQPLQSTTRLWVSERAIAATPGG